MSETLVHYRYRYLNHAWDACTNAQKDHGQWEIQPPVSRYRYIGRDVHVQCTWLCSTYLYLKYPYSYIVCTVTELK